MPDYNFTGEEGDFEAYCLHIAIDRAIKALLRTSYSVGDGGNEITMEMYQDGVPVYVLPDGAQCLLDDEGRDPLDLDKCPCGYDICSGSCAWYAE